MTAPAPPRRRVDSVRARRGALERTIAALTLAASLTVSAEAAGQGARAPGSDSEARGAPESGEGGDEGSEAARPAQAARVFLHVSTPKPVVVYHRPAGSSRWEQACTSPCDGELPVDGTYRIVGSGVSPTELGLRASAGERVDLVVRPASSGGMIVGGAMAVSGLIAACVSLVMPADEGATGDQKSLAGLAVGLGGGLLLVGGTIVFILSTRSDVVQSTTKAAPVAPRQEGRREPRWHASPGVDAIGWQAVLPLLQHSF